MPSIFRDDFTYIQPEQTIKQPPRSVIMTSTMMMMMMMKTRTIIIIFFTTYSPAIDNSK